ncbi:MAG: proteasome subunit beta [Acidimicrobiia bacterium]|nr:proteasome subunit beta [Acidimicrobiia bacterium]
MSRGASRFINGPLPLDSVVPEASFVSLLESEGMAPRWETLGGGDIELPEATTILALKYVNGVVMAGDRRATAGNVIAHRRMKKVFPADDYSAVAISGTAGMAVELIKLFQTELEHYEKIEGTRLSLEGKANYLARMVRNHLPLAFQGLAVVPLFCGYDEEAGEGRLYTFDVVGGRYEEQDYAATGSGGGEAKSFIKTVHDAAADEATALRTAVEALIAAAEEDAATGGPDVRRGIYPNVVTVTSDGFTEIGEDRVAEVAAEALEARP